FEVAPDRRDCDPTCPTATAPVGNGHMNGVCRKRPSLSRGLASTPDRAPPSRRRARLQPWSPPITRSDQRGAVGRGREPPGASAPEPSLHGQVGADLLEGLALPAGQDAQLLEIAEGPATLPELNDVTRPGLVDARD